MPVRPSRKQPFKDLIDEDWKIETGTLARLRKERERRLEDWAIDDAWARLRGGR